MTKQIYVVVQFDYPEYDNDAEYNKVIAAYPTREQAEIRARATSGVCHVEEINLYNV